MSFNMGTVKIAAMEPTAVKAIPIKERTSARAKTGKV